MKLARFTEDGRTRIGIVAGDEIIDLADACPELPGEMTELLAAGGEVLDRAQEAVAAGGGRRFSLDQVRLEAPIPRPPKFLGVGLNYADHAAETGRNPPEFPVFFNKQSTCVIGPGQPILLPRLSAQVDYEGELGLVIGRRARGLSRGQAREAIAGYLVVNDVSARDWQFRAPTMTLGKSFDTHGPIGPWIVTSDEVGDPHELELRTWVSGELRQHSNTKNLIFDCYALVELLSTVFTLEPGDIVSTGTPAGVGMAADPQRFLRAGDVVRVEIERIGVLENPVAEED